ncbi:hypothetical protein BG011_002286 [Mortierella polycephala]|uniref:DUF1640-domain-containing protein n=1 Tax=Mortierella polycephala TaxID=41804 RepID=A0A9P6Q6C7_9FUNG|nr:hypothetical protein BG011_002286 [Mortierella polycephala]
MATRITGRSIATASTLTHGNAACTRNVTRINPRRNMAYTSGSTASSTYVTTTHQASPSILPSTLYTTFKMRRSALRSHYVNVNQIRPFSASGMSLNDGGHHFDTHRFVEKLEREGFSRQQSEAIMNALDEVVTESMDNLTKNMVTKADQDKTVYTYKVDFAALKSELQMLEKNDFSLTNTNNERLVSEIEKLRQRLREEVARTQAGVRLDLNLEKGRIRDEAATQELKVRATEERIEQEIAGLRTQMETIKLQTLQYMIGTITGAGALILAYLRMFK